MSSTFVRDMRVALEVTNNEKQKVNDSHPDRVLYFSCLKPDDFKVDEDNSVYAMKLHDCFSDSLIRFKVSKCSTVFFGGVNITKNGLFHSGLLFENDFEVTQNGVTDTYPKGHLLAHAMFVRKEGADDLDTMLLVCMCKNREAAFNELARIAAKNAEYYTRAMSPGFVSSTPCSKVVEKLQAEIRKPFDKYWRERLTQKTEKLGDSMTNCAIFAARIFYSLAPTEDRQEIAVKGTLKVFQELGYSESTVKPYISAITT